MDVGVASEPFGGGGGGGGDGSGGGGGAGGGGGLENCFVQVCGAPEVPVPAPWECQGQRTPTPAFLLRGEP